MGRKKKLNLIDQNIEDSSIQAVNQSEQHKSENAKENKINNQTQNGSNDIKTEDEDSTKTKDKQQTKAQFHVFGEDFVLTDPDFINYQKINNKMLFLQFHLLGQFDKDGNYFVGNDIKRDLIKAVKEIQMEDDNCFQAELRHDGVTIHFDVDLFYTQENAEAKLYIVETVDEHTVKTFIDSFSAPNNADFRIKVREKYNLVDVAIKTDDEEIPNLSIWIYWQNEELAYWLDLYEMGSQFFVMRALAILEEYGEVGEKIINEFNRKLQIIERSGTTKRKFSKSKEVLDDVINQFGGIEEIDKNHGKLKKLALEYNKPFLSIEAGNVEIMEVEKPKTPAKAPQMETTSRPASAKKKTSTSTASSNKKATNNKAKPIKTVKSSQDTGKKKVYVTLEEPETQKSNKETKKKTTDESQQERNAQTSGRELKKETTDKSQQEQDGENNQEISEDYINQLRSAAVNSGAGVIGSKFNETVSGIIDDKIDVTANGEQKNDADSLSYEGRNVSIVGESLSKFEETLPER